MQIVVFAFPTFNVFPIESKALFSGVFVFWPPQNNTRNQHENKNQCRNTTNISSPIGFQHKTEVNRFDDVEKI